LSLVGDEEITAPIVVSNLDPSATFQGLVGEEALSDPFGQRVSSIDHRAAYFQVHFALDGLPQYAPPYELLNDPACSRNVTFFGTAEQMQEDFENCLASRVPLAPSFNRRSRGRRTAAS
jgi:phytoene dehydrogenase-like protein